jgi:hypothetical protein
VQKPPNKTTKTRDIGKKSFLKQSGGDNTKKKVDDWEVMEDVLVSNTQQQHVNLKTSIH